MTLVRNRLLSLTFAVAATMTCFVAVERMMTTTQQSPLAAVATGAHVARLTSI